MAIRRSTRASTTAVHDALANLAAIFPFGELMIATEPANFIRMVTAEVERLRTAAGESAYPAASKETP